MKYGAKSPWLVENTDAESDFPNVFGVFSPQLIFFKSEL